MKKFYQTICCGVIIPLVFFNALCCCTGGKAHAATVGASYQQSMAREQAHACCLPSNTKKCHCQNIFGTPESGTSQKGIVSQKTNGFFYQDIFVNGISSSTIVFIPPKGLSFYLLLTKYSQNNPPIYLLNRVFRL